MPATAITTWSFGAGGLSPLLANNRKSGALAPPRILQAASFNPPPIGINANDEPMVEKIVLLPIHTAPALRWSNAVAACSLRDKPFRLTAGGFRNGLRSKGGPKRIAVGRGMMRVRCPLGLTRMSGSPEGAIRTRFGFGCGPTENPDGSGTIRVPGSLFGMRFGMSESFNDLAFGGTAEGRSKARRSAIGPKASGLELAPSGFQLPAGGGTPVAVSVPDSTDFGGN